MANDCPVCIGGIDFGVPKTHECVFCNGTGEMTKAAENLMKNHICGCETGDRKNCQWCGKKCHHDSSQRPKVLIVP